MAKQSALTILIAFAVIISFSLTADPLNNNAEEFKVFMVLWRGITAAEAGFVDHFTQKNIAVNFAIRDCEKDEAKIPAIVKEIRDADPDLVYIFGTTLTTGIAGTTLDSNAESFITDIPIVFDIVADPIGANLVPNMVTSNRNLTGASHMVPISAQIKAMKCVMEFDRLGVIFNPQERNSILCIEALEDIADSDNFIVIKAPIPVGEDGKPLERIPPEIARPLVDKEVDLVYLPSDSFIISHSEYLVDLINE